VGLIVIKIKGARYFWGKELNNNKMTNTIEELVACCFAEFYIVLLTGILKTSKCVNFKS